MTLETNSTMQPSPERSAAEWFVALDADALSNREIDELAAWLAQDPEHAAAFARCAQAFALAAQLDGDGLALESTPRRPARSPLAPMLALLGRPAVAWSVTALVLAVAVAGWWRPVETLPNAPAVPAEAPSRAPVPMLAGRAPESWPVEPVVVLPGQVVVDALSVGVQRLRPAVATDDADRRTAAELYAYLVARLSSTPGYYVLGAGTLDPFNAVDVTPTAIASQVGVRAIVEGRVASDGESVTLELRLTDASRDAVLIDESFTYDAGELHGLLEEVVGRIMLTMAEPLVAAARPIAF
jgi:TolB-like protein